MTYNPTKIKVEETFECQACAVQVINKQTHHDLIELFKDLTGIKVRIMISRLLFYILMLLINFQPFCGDSDIVFCKNCQSTLEAFQLFRNLCVHTQEIFSCRQLCDGSSHIEEFIVGIEVEDTVDVVQSEVIESKEEVQYYICDMCKKQFKTKRGLKIHISSFHIKSETVKQDQKENGYQCKECNTTLSSMRNLKRHQATHNSEKCFKCSYCDSKFNSQQNQYYHERYVHKTGKQYVCSDCGYDCYNPTLMNVSVLIFSLV